MSMTRAEMDAEMDEHALVEAALQEADLKNAEGRNSRQGSGG